MKRSGTEEEWIQLGNLLKDAYKSTLDAIVLASNISGKSKSGCKSLDLAIQALADAKSNLENEMFSDLNPTGSDSQRLLNVFYGDKIE